MTSRNIRDVDRRTVIKATGGVGLGGLAGCTSGGGNGNGDDTATGGDGSSDWEPTQNVRVIIPWGAGGGTDTMTRSVLNPAEQIMSDRGVNTSFTFENVTGAGGLNAARRVLNQPADGHTLFPSTNVIGPQIATGQADFALDDWGHICRVQHDTSWLYTSGRDNAEHDSIDSIIEKAKSGTDIQIGVVGGITGAAFPVLWAEEAGILSNTNITTYQDAGRQRTDTISGEIDASFGEIQELQEQYDSGDINLVLVGVEEPLEDFPDVPTTGERGWDVFYGIPRGFNVKAGTPDGAIQFWSGVVEEAMQSDSYQQLEQEALLHLREGYQGPDEWKQTIQDSIDTYNQVRELYNPE